MARPANQAARALLPTLLARAPGTSAAELGAALAVSPATLNRLLAERAAELVVAGRARRTRYAWRRALRGKLSPLPLYEVDSAGRAEQVAQLALTEPDGSHLSLAGSHWPLEAGSAEQDGWWHAGLPYPLLDMRPQGYLGRQLALAVHRRLAVAASPEAWSDDEVVLVLGDVGSDMSGSLILGQHAFERWQTGTLASPEPVGEARLGAHYAALAEQAVALGVAGSSAAGEFPKFPALRRGSTKANGSARTPHVLVKFSGAGGSAAEERWADLLVCEHLALDAVGRIEGVAAAASRVLRHAGRCFLEVERFDRHGLFGRSPLVSLGTLDASLIGSASADWPTQAERLAAGGWLAGGDVQAVQRLWWFGLLIGNNDMHAGNLSFRPVPRPSGLRRPGQGFLALAPAYDMLPMQWAPLPGGELPQRPYAPPLPLPPQRSAWLAACSAALAFWRDASLDARTSDAMRAIATANHRHLMRVADRA